MTQVHMSNGASNSWVGDGYSQLLIDQIAVMVEKENDFYSCVDYLGELPLSSDLIDEGWRQKSAEWMFKVIDFYDLDRDIVNAGMAYLDEMFTVSSLHHRWDKQHCILVTMASLKIAIKLLEPRTMNMDDMIKLGMRIGGCFTPLAIVEMENEILWKLSWNVFPPTAFCLAHNMICMLPREVPKSPTRYIVQELTKYMLELAVCVYNFVKFMPSAKSFACCLVAMDSLDGDCLISPDERATFLERIFHVFGLRHDDIEIEILRKEMKELLCHNTDLKEFVVLIRASNKAANESESPKTAAVKTLCY
ncbi:hypothetical protein ACHAXR_012147 [Thalassiosira sp. AJA248-18]